MKASAAELTELADATQVLGSGTGTAEGHRSSLSKVTSFTGAHTKKMDPKLEVVTMARRLAQEEHSADPSQPASRISVVMETGAGAGKDPFAKVKKLITDGRRLRQRPMLVWIRFPK